MYSIYKKVNYVTLMGWVSMLVYVAPLYAQPKGNPGPMFEISAPVSASNQLFPLASSAAADGLPRPIKSLMEEAAPSVLVDVESDAVSSSTHISTPIFRALRVIPAVVPKIRWILFQAGDRSANTGQLTCLAWSRSLNLANSLEAEGPFHGAIAYASSVESLSSGDVWNNAGEASLTPLASKWDIPIWSYASVDSPATALSALYQYSKNATGSTNIAIAWDVHNLASFQQEWYEGLVKSGDLDGMQALSWKQKIREWSPSETNRVDIIEYTNESGKLRNVQWRSIKIRLSPTSHGCPTS